MTVGFTEPKRPEVAGLDSVFSSEVEEGVATGLPKPPVLPAPNLAKEGVVVEGTAAVEGVAVVAAGAGVATEVEAGSPGFEGAIEGAVAVAEVAGVAAEVDLANGFGGFDAPKEVTGAVAVVAGKAVDGVETSAADVGFAPNLGNFETAGTAVEEVESVVELVMVLRAALATEATSPAAPGANGFLKDPKPGFGAAVVAVEVGEVAAAAGFLSESVCLGG